MIKIEIPGYKTLKLKYLVLDYNGTLACDGKMIEEVETSLQVLSKSLEIHIITADTFGKVKSAVKNIPSKLSILPPGNQDAGKLQYIRKLGCEHTVAIGNGRNDRLMLQESILGIAVILEEGASAQAIIAADVVCTDIKAALNLLQNPLRLTATLRS